MTSTVPQRRCEERSCEESPHFRGASESPDDEPDEAGGEPCGARGTRAGRRATALYTVRLRFIVPIPIGVAFG